MIIQKKPDYLIFADSAKKGEVTDFPDVNRGWGITIDQTASKPPLEWMNGAFNRIDKNMLYLLQQGVPEWSESVTYPSNAIVKFNGIIYIAKVENNNSNPANSINKWTKLIPDASIEHKGIVQLSSAIDSKSEGQAATSKAIKTVNDKVEQVAQTLLPKTGGTTSGTIKAKAPVMDKIITSEQWKEGLDNKSIISSDQWAIFNGTDWPYLGKTSNITIASWWGVGFAPLYSLDGQPKNNTVVIDTRAGTVTAKGGFYDNGVKLVKQGDYGLGTRGMVTSSMNRPIGSAFIAIASTDADKPKVNGGVCGFQTFSTNNGYGMQLVSTNNADAPMKIFARSVENDKKVGEWVEFLKKGDYGIGSYGATFSDNNFDEMNIDQTGFYNLGKDSKGTFPQGFSEFSSMIHLSRSNNEKDKKGSQIIIDTHNNRIAYRTTHINGFKPWAEFITTNNLNSYMPVGIPKPWPSAIPPEGWLKCDGSEFDKIKYPLLAKAYPLGKLPDLRGEFIRGYDDGRKVDLDRTVLSQQGDQARNAVGFWHCKNRSGVDGILIKKTGYTRGGGDGSGSSDQHTIDFSAVWPTGDEFRPRNIAFLYIVKAE